MGARRELVEIHAKSNLAQLMARDAAATRAAGGALDSFSGSAVESDRATQRMSHSLSQSESSFGRAGRSTRQASDSINQLTGRLRLAVDVAAILGPALAPIGVLAVPAVTGLANQLGFAAAAAGTAVLAFQGVGDAVTAMNDYALAPTADNAAKVEEALTKMAPAAAQFAREVSGMRDQFAATRDAAAEGLFGGLTPALDDLDGLLGRVQPVLREIGAATGDALAGGLESLNSDRWQPFFDFLQAEARPVMIELGQTVGDFGHGLAELWMAFQPLNRDFSGWLRDVASSFDGWAAGLAETEGFQDFVAYIRESGPQVGSSLSALGGALVDIVTAAAPLGGPVLAGIEAFSKAVSAIADSPIGPVLLSAAAAMALFNRAMAVGTRVAGGNFFATTAANVSTLSSGLQTAQSRAMGLRSSLAAISAGRGQRAAAAALPSGSQAASQAAVLADNADRARSSLAGMAGAAGRVAGPMAGMALAMSDAGQEMALANTASFALMGSFAGIPGAVAGATIGAIVDLAAANDDLTRSIELANAAVESGDLSQMETQYAAMREEVDKTQENIDNFWSDFVRLDGIGNNIDALGGMFGGIFGGNDLDDQRSAMNELEGEITEAGGATSQYASETQRAAGAAAAAAANVARLSRKLADQAADARTAFGAQTNWAQAVRNARDAVRDGEKGLRGNSQAAIDNRQTLQGLADAWAAMPPKVQNNIDRFQAARGEFIRTARGMGATAGEARNLANRMLGVPKSVITRVEANVRQATRGLELTEAQIRRITRQIARPQVRPETSKAQQQLGNVRQQLERFRNQKASPRVDANTGPAMRKLRALQGFQRRFNGSEWQSTLDLNAGPANRKVNQMTGEVRKFAGLKGTASVDVNDRSAQRNLENVTTRMRMVGGLKATTNVDSNTAGANNAIQGHASYLSSINGRTSSTYVNNYITTIRRTRTERAMGGAVYSRRPHGLLSGPGTGTSDSIPVEASNGEYFTRAAAVRHYGVGVMDQINDMRVDRRALVEAAMSSDRRGGGRMDVRVVASGAVTGPTGESFPLEMMVEDVVDRRMMDWQNDGFDDIHGRR